MYTFTTQALPLNLKNAFRAVEQSPLGQPGFKIGEVVGANTVRIGDKIVTIDDLESKTVLDYGTKVVVYRQGQPPKIP